MFVFFAVTLSATPQTPANLILTYNAPALTASWEAVADTNTAFYALYRGTYQGFSETDYNFITFTASASQFTLTDPLINSSDAYYYKVAAVDAFSNTGTLTSAKRAFPFPPSAVYAEPWNTKVFLSWSGNYDGAVTGYNIYRSTYVETGYSLINYTKNSEYLDSDTALINGETYYYRLSAGSNGEGPYTVPVAVAPFAAPCAPKLASFTASSGNTVVNLNWSVTGTAGTYPVTGYNIYRATYQNPSDLIWYAQGVTTSHYTDIGLAEGNRYYYALKTVDVEGNTSIPYSFSVLTAPSAPTALTFTTSSAGVRLAWIKAGVELTQYKIYKAHGGPLTYLNSTNTFTAYYVDSAVNTYTEYYYAVSAVNPLGETLMPGWITVTPEVSVIITPSAPENFAAVSTTFSAGVILSWNANAPAELVTQYNIYRATSSGFENIYTYPAVTNTSYEDVPPETSVKNYYRVSAVNTVEGDYSSVTITPFTLPVAPLNLTGTGKNTYAEMHWDAAPDFENVTLYNIYRSTDGLSFIKYAGTTKNAYTDTSLVNSANYLYKISSTNKYGESAETAFVSVTPSAVAALTAPVGVTLLSNGDGKLKLSWDSYNAADNVSGYNIYRSTIPGESGLGTVYAFTGTATFTDAIMNTASAESVSSTTRYYYSVKAYNGDLSPLSGEISGIPSVLPFAPTNISGAYAVSSVILTWGAPSGEYTNKTITKYLIRRSTAQADATFVTLAQTTNTYYTDAVIDTNTAVYYYKVKTIDDLGNTDTSQTNEMVIIIPLTQGPDYIKAVAGENSVTIFWKKVSSDSYNIYRSTIPGVYGERIANVAQIKKEYTDTNGLINGTTYYYTLATQNTTGEGPKSTEVFATPYIAAKLPANSLLRSTRVGKKDILIDWDAATKGSYTLLGYKLQRSSDGGGTYQLLTTTAEIQYLDTQTDWGNTYYYMLTTLDDEGNQDAVYSILSIDLPKPANKLRVFANMINLSKGETLKLRFQAIEDGAVKINAYTLSGEFVKTIREDKTTGVVSKDSPYESLDFYWDGTNTSGQRVASGVYLLSLEIKGQKFVKKIAVVK